MVDYDMGGEKGYNPPKSRDEYCFWCGSAKDKEQARRKVVEEILACEDLRIQKLMIPTESEEYFAWQEATTDEVLERLKESE